MSKSIVLDDKIKNNIKIFMKQVDSSMHFKSENADGSTGFAWVDEVEFACPYIDNIVRNPRVALVSEEEVVKVEKAKKITVDSVKDLTKHTHFIEKVNKKQEVQPSKLLEVRSEETFNTYENRFVYTLIYNLKSFISQKEKLLEEYEEKNNNTLEYAASTTTKKQKINIELKITSKELPKDKNGNGIDDEVDAVLKKLKLIKRYMVSWDKSEFVKSLTKIHVPLVKPPITKTNLILKNPNFQIAMRLWGFLQIYDLQRSDSSSCNVENLGNNTLKNLLDQSFLMDYFVLDSSILPRKEQKERLVQYAIMMLSEQVKNAVSILLNSGIKITDEEILAIISEDIKNEKSQRLIGSTDVKKKFKSAMDEYLERTQSYL